MPSPKIALPYLVASQAQKEVTHNEALNRLDALVMPNVLAIQFTPPGSPVNGNTYIIGGGTATGAWATRETQIAAYVDGWLFFAPVKGWTVYNQGDDKFYTYNGTGWTVALLSAAGQIAAQDGTNGAPIYSFAADTNTGMYRIGADDLGFATNGTLRFRIDSSGNLRAQNGALVLGTESAAIQADASYLYLKDPSGGNRIIIGEVGVDNRVMINLQSTAGGSSFVVRDSGGTQAMKINDAGNLFDKNDVQLLTTRRTGWAAPTGTATRTTFATSTVTLPLLAERVKALIDDLTTHGVIGA
jgi:hypothetical protein